MPALRTCEGDGEKQNEQNMRGLTRKTFQRQILFSEINFPVQSREFREAISECHLAR